MTAEKNFLPSFHIFLSEDLTKEAFIHWTDNLGKRHRKKGGINRYHTYEERLAAAEALIVELKKNYVPSSTVGEEMLKWVEENRGRWRRKSWQSIRSCVDCFVEWGGGRKVDAVLVKAFFQMLATERHGKTHNKYLQRFTRIFKAIGRPELIDGIEPISSVSTPAKYFQRHQITKIKEYLEEHDPELWLACEFLYYCFIRPGELRCLKISDIHFDEWKICVPSEVSKNKKQQYVVIPVAFRPSIEKLMWRSPNEYIFFKHDCTKPTAINYLSRRFRSVLKRLGFGQEYKFYSWKHTGAVAAVKAGISLKHLQIQLRHHSLEEVDRYIRQLGVEDLDDLEEKFPAI